MLGSRTDAVSLVGRSEELGLAQRALGVGPGGGIVLMGRGALARRGSREVAERFSASRDARYLWVSATRSAGGVPFGAFAHLLPALDARGLDRLAVMMLARRAVLDVAEKDSALLVVDDAHLLDDASAALLHQLVMAHALHVVATVRSAEPAPDAVVALWKDGWLECLDVQPLDRVALGELVAGARRRAGRQPGGRSRVGTDPRERAVLQRAGARIGGRAARWRSTARCGAGAGTAGRRADLGSDRGAPVRARSRRSDRARADRGRGRCRRRACSTAWSSPQPESDSPGEGSSMSSPTALARS